MQRGYATSDGATLVVQTGFEPFTTSLHGLESSPANLVNSILLIDAASGTSHVAATWEWSAAPQLWLDASSDETAVFVANAREGIPVATGVSTSLGLVDVATAAVLTTASSVAL